MIRIGTAGWALPQAAQGRFPAGDSNLARYAGVFAGAEINSSFHRPHRASTYARWADSVPEGFRFSVKLSKAITHEAKLVKATGLLDEFLAPVRALGERFGCLLVQLPPKLAFDRTVARHFFTALATRGVTHVALEPRHASWFDEEADAFLAERGIVRVAADPPRAPGGDLPGGAKAFVYHRLHGRPRTYYSAYDERFLASLAARISRDGLPGWCIFDNTAGNAAVPNALSLMDRLEARGHETQAAALRARVPRRAGQSPLAGGGDGAAARQGRR